MGRVEPEVARDPQIGVDRRLRPRLLVPPAPPEQRAPRPSRLGPVLVLAGQVALGQRGIGQQPDVLPGMELRQADLVGPVQQVVGVLHARHPRLALDLGEMQEPRQPPGGFVGQADVPDLPGFHQPVQRVQRLLDRDLAAVAAMGGRAGLRPEHRHGTVRPVELVEIHVVGLQPAQRGVDRLVDVPGVEPRQAAVRPQPGPAGRPRDLGGEHHPVPSAAGLQPGPDDPLRRAVGLGPGRDRIGFGRVEEVDPVVEGVVDLGVALALAVLLAPGHGAEADRGDGDPRAPQRTGIGRGLEVGSGVHLRSMRSDVVWGSSYPAPPAGARVAGGVGGGRRAIARSSKARG